MNVTNPAALGSSFRNVGVNLATAPLDNLPVFTSGQFSGLLAAGTGLAGVSYLNRRVFLRPIQALLDGTRAVAAGNLDTRIEVKGEDELS